MPIHFPEESPTTGGDSSHDVIILINSVGQHCSTEKTPAQVRGDGSENKYYFVLLSVFLVSSFTLLLGSILNWISVSYKTKSPRQSGRLFGEECI